MRFEPKKLKILEQLCDSCEEWSVLSFSQQIEKKGKKWARFRCKCGAYKFVEPEEVKRLIEQLPCP